MAQIVLEGYGASPTRTADFLRAVRAFRHLRVTGSVTVPGRAYVAAVASAVVRRPRSFAIGRKAAIRNAMCSSRSTPISSAPW